jgi:hypothetical protein
MSRSRRDHPDMRDDAPGRIPESLIDAAMDGELDAEIQKEIGHALNYDPVRKQQFHDTRDAINALRMPIDSPDLSDRVLERAHRHRRFIPSKLRQQVRTGRVVMAALLLTTLLGVAGLQRAFPRLTTFGAQSTPVANIESAVEQSGQQLAQTIVSDFQRMQECVEPVQGLLVRSLERPGSNNFTYTVQVASPAPSATPSSSEPLSFPHPNYAIVKLAYTSAQAPAPSRRSGFAHQADANRFVLASFPSSPSRTEPPNRMDDPIELP